jgi:hypothetical protein
MKSRTELLACLQDHDESPAGHGIVRHLIHCMIERCCGQFGCTATEFQCVNEFYEWVSEPECSTGPGFPCGEQTRLVWESRSPGPRRDLALRLSQIAATEASLERLFSYLRSIITERTRSMSDELGEARIAVTMDYLFEKESDALTFAECLGQTP